jgi:hypothetical protein
MPREHGEPPPPPGEIDETRRKMLQGKPLASRPVWFLKRFVYVIALIGAVAAVLAFADGLWLAVGLTVLAFPAGMLPELFIDLRYSNYRREWEIANKSGSDARTSSSR